MNLKNILKFYQNHKKYVKWFILIFSALFTAFLYLLYWLYLFYNLKSKGELTYPLRTENFTGLQSELTLFAIRVREMIDGYWNNSDPGFFEYRNSPVHIYEPLLPAIYYFIYLFVGFKYLFVVGDFLMIAAIFVLVFALVYLLTNRYYISLFFTFMFLMVKDFLFLLFPGLQPMRNISQLKDLLKAFSPFILHGWHAPDRLNFLVYASTRPGYLFFVPALIFLFLFIKNKKFLYAVLLGIFYGLLFYVYPYYWMYMTIVFGLLGMAYLFQKNFAQLKQLVFSGVIAWLISICYWISQWKLRNLPYFKDILINFIIEYGYVFKWNYYFLYIFCAILAVLIYFYAQKKKKMHLAYYFIPMFLAGFIGFNMQVLTGVNIQSTNWWQRLMFFPIFLASTVLFTWFFEGLEKKNKLMKNIVIMLMIVIAIFQVTGAVQGQAVLAEDREREHIMEKGVAESLIWIDKNLPNDSVFLTPDPETNWSFLIYTSGRTFIQYPYIDTVSREERAERLYAVYNFFQIAPEIFEKKFREQDFGYGNLTDSETIKQEIISGYKDYKLDLAQVLTKYKIDYIYYEPADKELTDVDFDKFDYLEKIYSNDGGVNIYKLLPEKINSKQ